MIEKLYHCGNAVVCCSPQIILASLNEPYEPNNTSGSKSCRQSEVAKLLDGDKLFVSQL